MDPRKRRHGCAVERIGKDITVGRRALHLNVPLFLSIFQPNRNGRLRGLAFALLRNTGIILPCFSKAWPLRPCDSSCQLSPPKELALWKLLIRDLIAYLQHVLLLLSQRNILTGNTSREMDENTGLLLHGDHVEQLFPTGVGFAITLFLTNPLLGRKSCSQTGQRVPNLPLTHVPSWSPWTQRYIIIGVYSQL